GLAAVRAAATAAGRTAGAVVPGLFASVAVTRSVAAGRRLLAEFSQANYGLPVEQLETIQALAAGPPSYVAERLSAYVATGAQHRVGSGPVHRLGRELVLQVLLDLDDAELRRGPVGPLDVDVIAGLQLVQPVEHAVSARRVDVAHDDGRADRARPRASGVPAR